MRTKIIVKSVVLVGLLSFCLFSSYGIISSIKLSIDQSKALQDNLINQQEVDVNNAKIKDSLVRFASLRGSNNYSDDKYVLDSISTVEGCSSSDLATVKFDKNNSAMLTTVKELPKEKSEGISISLSCKNVEASAKILDGYKFLYNSFVVDFTKNKINLIVDLRG